MSEEEPFGPRVRALLGLEPAKPPSEVRRLLRQSPHGATDWAFEMALGHATATDLHRRIPRKRRRGRPPGSTDRTRAQYIRAYRDMGAPSQEALAEALGVSTRTIQTYASHWGWPPE